MSPCGWTVRTHTTMVFWWTSSPATFRYMMSMAISLQRSLPPGDIERGNNLLRVLPADRGQQFRVRIDVRVRLSRGLKAPLCHDLRPGNKLLTTPIRGPDPFSSFRVPQAPCATFSK